MRPVRVDLHLDLKMRGMSTRKLVRGCAQGSFNDAAGQTGLPLAPLSFQRVSDPLLKGTAFQILLPPALKAMTG